MPIPEPHTALARHICLAGPTASGKTAISLALAQRFDLEIISVDSALVYRGMDIGTAKPSAQERAAVPHHLIDIRDPAQPFSAAEFVRQASALIRDISARGKLALLVGGTMLYFKALAQGLDDMPAADPAVRERLEHEAAQHGWAHMHARLARYDPSTAQRLAPQDSQRIARALEVLELTGLPLSHFHGTRSRQNPGNGGDGGYAGVLIALEPGDRAWLHTRIAQRFDTMLQSGLLAEVAALRARGDLHAELPSMRCVGYRQAWEALDGRWPMSELRDKGIFATRQLAKRQITWLRSMPQRLAIDCQDPLAAHRVHERIEAALQRRGTNP